MAAPLKTKKGTPDDEDEKKSQVVVPRVHSQNAYTGAMPSCLFDGTTSTMWNAGHQTGWDKANWIVFDFKHRVRLTKFAYRASGDTTHDPKVIQLETTKKVSSGLWNVVANYDGLSGVSAWQEFDVTSGIFSRYWRVNIPTRWSRYQLFLQEMRFEVAPEEDDGGKTGKAAQRQVFVDNLQKWLQEASLYDVTFIVGNPAHEVREFQGIKQLFALNSPYFAAMFKGDPDVKRVKQVDISPLGFEYISSMILNRGGQSISLNNILDVLHASSRYEMKGVEEPCRVWLAKFMRRQSKCKKLLKLLDRCMKLNLSEATLKSLVDALIPKLSRRILMRSTVLMDLPLKSVISIVSSDNLVCYERHVWKFCRKWCENDFQRQSGGAKHRTKKPPTGAAAVVAVSAMEEEVKTAEGDEWKGLMKKFSPHIRFEHMQGKFFVKNVVPSEVLSRDEIMQYSLEILNPRHRPKKLRRKDRGEDVESKSLRAPGAAGGSAGAAVLSARRRERIRRKCRDIGYELTMSSRYGAHCTNTFESLQDGIYTTGCATNRSQNEWIQATWKKRRHIAYTDIAPPMMAGGWNNAYIRDSVLQYRKGKKGEWVTLTNLQRVANNAVTDFDVDVVTDSLRIWCPGQNWVGASVWKIYAKKVSKTDDASDEDDSSSEESVYNDDEESESSSEGSV